MTTTNHSASPDETAGTGAPPAPGGTALSPPAADPSRLTTRLRLILAIVLAEAGSASGALSAVQQLAAAMGSAVVTTVYFSQQARHGAGHAMTVSVAVVGAIALLDLGLVWLLPKSAPQEQP
jgi:hypothetical protein